MSDDFVYLTREGDDGEGAAPPPGDAHLLRDPRRDAFVGSGRYFALWIGIGTVLGLVIGALLGVVRSGDALVTTERSITWLAMLFATLGALLGAVVAVTVEALVDRRR